MPGGAGGCSEVLGLVEVDDLLRFNCSENARDETRRGICVNCNVNDAHQARRHPRDILLFYGVLLYNCLRYRV